MPQNPETNAILRSDDSLERQNEKLSLMIASLMRRVESDDRASSNAFAHFQTAATLEAQVRQRTLALEDALDQLNNARAKAEGARAEADQARRDLSDAIEAIREGFALFDPDNVLVHANSRFARLFPDIVSSIEPGLRFEDYIQRVACSSEIVFADGVGREDWLEDRLRFHDQPNKHFLVELVGDRWVQISEQSTRSGATTIIQTEVTDMVRLERMERRRLLDEQMELVRATLEHIDQGVLIVDQNRLIAGSNTKAREHLALPLEFFTPGYRMASVIDEVAEKQIFFSTRDLFLLVDWMRNKNRKKTFRGELRRHDSRLFDVFAQTMPNDGFVISLTDVSLARKAARELEEAKSQLEQRVEKRTEELREARDIAEQASHAKTRFLAATSHDLLQPINATKLFVQALKDTDLDEGQALIANNIAKAYDSVEAMLRGLLDISRLDTPAPVEKTAISVQDIFETLRVEFAPIATAKGIDLKFRSCRCGVISEPSHLRRIAQNLIGNAIKYTSKGGVLVGTRCRGEEIFLEVFDTGPGLAEHEMTLMYNEFQRFSRENEGGAGMGLGLSIVQRSSALLGHELEVYSRLGRGTHFRLHLPRAIGFSQISRHAGEPQITQKSPLTNMMVLVVDDDEDILTAMSIILENWGATPLLAQNAEDGISLFEEVGMAADVALVDFQLDDGLDGLEEIEKLRTAYPDLPAALITANRDLETKMRARDLDVEIFQKPLASEALHGYLAQLLKN